MIQDYIRSALILFFMVFATSSGQVRILSPDTSQAFFVDSTVTIAWTGGENSEISLWFSTNSGRSWDTLATHISGTSFRWKIPDFDADSLMIRIDAEKGIPTTPIWTIPNAHDDDIRIVRFADDGRTILSGGDDRKLKIWRTSDGKLLDSVSLPTDVDVFDALFYRSDSLIIVPQEHSLGVWNRKTRQVQTFFAGTNDDIHGLALTDNGVISGGFGQIIRHWTPQANDLSAWNSTQIFSVPQKIYTLAISPNKSNIAYAGDSGFVYLRAWQSSEKPMKFSRHSAGIGSNAVVWSCDVHPDGTKIASASVDKSVKIWDKTFGDSALATLSGFGLHVRSAQFSPDGKRLLSASLDNSLRQFETRFFTTVGASVSHGAQALCARYSPTGDSLISSGRDGAIRLWFSGRSLSSSDTLRKALKRQILLEIPDMTGKIGRGIDLPVLWKNRTMIRGIDTIRLRAVIESPAKLLKIFPAQTHIFGRYSARWDTISVEISAKGTNDTVAIIPARLLMGAPPSDSIRFRRVLWENTTRLYDVRKDGSIALEDSCGSIYDRAISLGGYGKGGIIHVSPNPVHDHPTIVYALVGEDEMQLDIIDARGNIVKILEKGRKFAGEFSTALPISALGAGEYFVRLRYAATVYYAKFILAK